MSFLTRVRLAIVRWWIRSAEARRRSRAARSRDDLEGIGRRLAGPPLCEADDDYPPVSATLPVTKKPMSEPKIPARLVIRFDV